MSNLLKKQLELAKFEKTIEYVSSSARGQKHLNAQELAHINNMLTGSSDDPWRTQPVTLQLPSGNEEHFSVVSNPMIRAREIIFQARDTVTAGGDVGEAATKLYQQLVLSHLFKEANRRTAVAATSWLLCEHGINIPALGLLELGIGDLRAAGQSETLRGLIKHTIEIAKSRKG